MQKKYKFKFIDLFAGIGGFHQALANFGGECVFASEIDPYAIETYEANYKIDSNHDITKIPEQDIPKHDVLCAGFPCQAFSKAGKQNGFHDTRGTLFFEIERILRYHKTKYIILENVRNLTSHDGGKTWKVIHDNLRDIGYRLTEKPMLLSPHHFGIPHLRERVFIVGIYDPMNVDKPLVFDYPNLKHKKDNNIYDVVDVAYNHDKSLMLTDYEYNVLNVWDEFYQGINQKILGFPIWVDSFFSNTYEQDSLPDWKKEFIYKNQQLYRNNKKFIDAWLKKHNYLNELIPTHKKFEWQAGTDIKSLWEGVIQFRPSGIRVKKPDVFPALVAMVHIPIIGKFKRRLSVRECARLQSFPDDFVVNKNTQQAYKQFGNSLNVSIVIHIVEILFNQYNYFD
jgi:DNA (cytosine-5)-methyltransferase 1